MKLDNCIAQLIIEYSRLYNAATAELSRLLVLDQLFLTLGNGYGWTPDGYLADVFKFDSEWSGGQWHVLADSTYATYGQEFSLEGITYRNAAERDSWEPYAAWHNTAISYVPHNIQNDWLSGAIEIVQAAVMWYQNSANFDFYMEAHLREDEPAKAELLRQANVNELIYILGRLNLIVSERSVYEKRS